MKSCLKAVFVLVTCVTYSLAQCTRAQLIQARDAFFQSANAGDLPQLAPAAKVVYNNKALPIIHTPYPSIGTSSWTKLNIEAVDEHMCNIATFRVAKEQLLSTRLKLDPASSRVSEVEFFQATSGDFFFLPSGFPSETPELWTRKQVPHAPPVIPTQWTPANGMLNQTQVIDKTKCKAMTGEPRLWNRRELLYAASSYADGLHGSDPHTSCVFDSGWCPRIENGVPTSWNCAQFLFPFDFDVRARRWTVDTEIGVVLGSFYFDSARQNFLGRLVLNEYFKMESGGLKYIYAPMSFMKAEDATREHFPQETN